MSKWPKAIHIPPIPPAQFPNTWKTFSPWDILWSWLREGFFVWLGFLFLLGNPVLLLEGEASACGACLFPVLLTGVPLALALLPLDGVSLVLRSVFVAPFAAL